VCNNPAQVRKNLAKTVSNNYCSKRHKPLKINNPDSYRESKKVGNNLKIKNPV